MGNEVGILAPTDEATMARKIRMGQVTVAKVARERPLFSPLGLTDFS